MPGQGVCTKIFSEKECDFWSFKYSDELGYGKLSELNAQNLSHTQLDKTLLNLSKKEIFKNPPLYVLYMGIESLKMFFWESTQIGFVTYPHWLTKLFIFTPFKNGLRLLIFFLTLFGFIFTGNDIWKNRKNLWQKNNPSIVFTFLLIVLFISIHSFFFTLTRYSLPIAPLFLILIAYTTQNIFKKSN